MKNDLKKFSDEMIDIIRQDIASGFSLTRMENKVRERMKAEGKDFDAEFEKYLKEKNQQGGGK